MEIHFQPIDIDRHFDHCFHFRKDSYFCSFGSEIGFEASIEGYEAKIRSRLADKEWYYRHIWRGNEIIGQLEFKTFSQLANTGYLHLIYLADQYRGMGYADLAHNFLPTN